MKNRSPSCRCPRARPLRRHRLLPLGQVAEAEDDLPDRVAEDRHHHQARRWPPDRSFRGRRWRSSPRVSGIVEEIAVEPGQSVKEGDLIARIRLVPDMAQPEQRAGTAWPGPRSPSRARRRTTTGTRPSIADGLISPGGVPAVRDRPSTDAQAELRGGAGQPRSDREGHLPQRGRRLQHARPLHHLRAWSWRCRSRSATR